MKNTKIASLVMAACMTLSTFSGLTVHAAGTSMTIDTSKVIKTASGELYGLSTDFSCEQKIVNVDENGTITNNEQIIKALNEYQLPLVRLGEGSTRQVFKWKDAIGDYNQRPSQKLWSMNDKVAEGPLEQINFYEAADKNASFTVTLNVMGDTVENAADYAEFLTGDVATEWGAKRAEMGHSAPVDVKAYEIGNEVEWDGGANTNVWTSAQYIAKAKEVIAAIEAVDTDAKFAVHADTTAYNSNRSGDGWRNWHNDILSDAELASKIDYIAVHAYFEPDNNSGINNLISKIESDIKAKTGSDRIKIYLSEYAVYYDETLSNPHNLTSVINTANILSRIALDKDVAMTTYHGLDSSNWKNIVYNPAKDHSYLNGIGQMLKTFKEYGVGDVVESTFTGFSKDAASTTSSGIAVKTENGVNLIFTNGTKSDISVALNFADGKEYKIKEETVITRENADIAPGNADIDYDKKDITATKYSYNTENAAATYSVPAYSVCAVALEEKNSKTASTLWSDVASGSYTVYGDASGEASLSGNNLVLKSGDETTYGDVNYVYLPYNNQNAEFTVEADVEINKLFDGGIFGVVVNSSVNNDVPTANMVKFDADSAEEVTVEDGMESDPLSTKNIGIAEGNTYKISVTNQGGKISASLNGTILFERSGELVNASGYAGFMFSDVNCTLKNIRFVEYKEIAKVEYPKSFTFTENFDNVPDGLLPDGWEAMSGRAVAGVFDGELILDSQEWWSPAWVKIPGLDNVNRSSLVMEADVRFISNIEEARAGEARNQAGFAYMANGDALSSTGILTFAQQTETNEYGKSVLGAGNNCDFSDGEVKKLKIMFGSTGSPNIFIDGTKCSPEFPHAETTNNVGAVGLQAIAAKVAFDNVKITGTTKEYAPAADMVYSDFTYFEDFEGYEEGICPGGYTPISAKASAVIENGQLKVTADEWWSQTGILIDELANVKREGLTVEMDMTLVSYADGAETGGAQPGASFIIKDDTGMGYYQMRAVKDPQWGSFMLVRDGLKLQANVGDEFTSNQKITLKLTFDGAGRTATGYVNGVQKRTPLTVSDHVNNTDAYISPTIDEGQLAIGGNGVVVLYDNIKITGKKLMPVTETGNIKIELTGGQTRFETTDAAITAAKVSYTDVNTDGYVDVTADAEITAVAKSETEYQLVANYNGLTAVIGCIIKPIIYYDFVYEENFDGYANGAIPTGFTPIDAKASAVIENGQLKVTADEWWSQTGVLIDSLKNVKRDGLTIEMDMTLVSYADGAESQGAQPGASVMIKDNTGTGYYQMRAVKDPDWGSFLLVRDGLKLQANVGDEFTSNQKITLKLTFDGAGRTATGYVNGVQKRNPLTVSDHVDNKDAYICPAIDEGQLAIGGNGVVVLYDNIKITGKMGLDESISESAITVASSKYENGKINANAEIEDNSAVNANVYLAVYEKATNRLVAVSAKSVNTAAYPVAKLNLELSGVANYSADTHTVKVMVIGQNTMEPIAPNAQF